MRMAAWPGLDQSVSLPPRLLAVLVIPCLFPKPKILTFTLDSFLGARSNKKENSAESSVTKNGQHQS